MSRAPEAPSRWAPAVSVGVGVLLSALFYLCVLFRIDPRLLYHHQSPVFMTGLEFLGRFAGRPGGLGEYGSLFLSQFCRWAWAGAAVITTVTLLICLATRRLLRSVSEGRVHPWVWYFPGVLLLILHGRYNYPLVASVGLLTVLVSAGLYVRWSAGGWVRLPVFGVSAAILYYLVGVMVVLFGVLCGIFEMWKHRAVVTGAAGVVIASVLPFVFAMCSWEVTPVEAYGGLLAWGGGFIPSVTTRARLLTVVQVSLLVFLSAAVLGAVKPEIVAAVGRGIRRGVGAIRRKRGADGTVRETKGTSGAASPTRWTLVSLCAFLVVANVLVSLSFDAGVRTRLQLGRHAVEKSWEAVLASARRLPSDLYDDVAAHDVNRALYHLGRLPTEMFAYPQRRDSDSLFLYGARARALSYPTYLKSSVILFELGLVNRSQKAAHIAYETFGEHPEMLKLLVRINVLKGRLPVARGFLSTLSRNLLYRSWAEDFRERLEADPVTASDEEIRRVRPLVSTADHGWAAVEGVFPGYEGMVGRLLEANPHNRMAFEYLMAHYLITKQLDKVVAGVDRLADFDYVGIPRYYEEAILLYEAAHPDRKVELHGRQITDEARTRFHDWNQQWSRYQTATGPDKRRALEALTRDLGDSYFFYHTANYSVRRTKLGYPDLTTGATR